MRDAAPLALIATAVVALAVWGPIAQPPHYHEFADTRSIFGIPNGADVLSNAGFALAGIWGLSRLWMRGGWQARHRPGWTLFLAAVVLTSAGSTYYHLQPDNARLVWDRLPIALACAGLIAAVRFDTRSARGDLWTLGLACAAILSVGWWYVTEQAGAGDLRPYLLLQGLPLVVIPLWQAAEPAPRHERLAFGSAIVLYVAAKVVEVNDHTIYAGLGVTSGHTLKHLLAAGAAAVIIHAVTCPHTR
jgi:hypothetical protein